MKAKLVFLVSAAVLLTVFGACAGAQDAEAPRQVSVAISADEFAQTPHMSKQVEVAQGGTLTVKLSSNPSTGFQWTEQAQIGDPAVAGQTAHRYMAPEAQGGTPPPLGAPGNEEWTFSALKAGTTTLSMRYARPWQSDMGEWSLELTVTVKAAR